MKEGKHARKKFKIIEVYSVLIFIAALFMCIGYAQISGTLLNITGTAETDAQKGVFITKITNISEAQTNSEINYFIQTMFESKTILENINTSTQTYEITLYNNSNKQHVFIGALTDTTDGVLYDNENIEFDITGIEQYITTIEPNQSLKFTITFKYKKDADLSKNILNSKINFRFKEMPKLVLSNDGQRYILNDIYPDYTPQQYEFSVLNYIGDEINSIPLNYSFDIKIDKPLSAKIYDENNNEVTNNINFDGDEQEKQEHKYTLKITWDNSNEEDLEYDSSKYENMQFSCQVTLTAQTDDEKYLGFLMEKQFDIVINSGDYKNSYTISYIDITNFDYPTESAQGEDIEITFVKEIPVDVQVTGVESYTYNKPTLIINNVTSDVEIINTTGELIAYEYNDDYVFNGNNYINTETALFSEANATRNFRMIFEIKADDLTQAGYSTIMAAMNEAGKPTYPGFLFRVGEKNKHDTEFEVTVNSTAGKKAYFSLRETTTKVEFARISNIVYLRINDGEYMKMQDFTNFTEYFDVPVTFGAGINSSGSPFRYFKGTLSNIGLKFLSESAALDLMATTNGIETQ